MRIGFFTDTYTPQINGVVTSIRLFATALEARGHEVYVFAPTPRHPDDADRVVRFPSMPWAFQPEMRVASPVSIAALRTLDSLKLDIVHSHDPFSIGLLGLNVAWRKRIPYVHTYHTLYPEYVHYVWETRLTKRLAERLSRDFCQRCDSIVAPSSKVDAYLRAWGVTVPVDVIATGIDVETYARPEPVRLDSLRARLSLGAEERVVLFVGRLGREKNIELLLRALWHSRHPNVKLLVVGDGPHRHELEAIAAELGLENRVIFAGYLERADTVAAYHLADVFAFASTTETQGLVIGEAMAAGLPVLAVHDHAVEDFVVDGQTGFVVPALAEDLARALDDLLADETERARLAEASRERSSAFSIECQAEKLEAHYERAMDRFVPRVLLKRPALPRFRR